MFLLLHVLTVAIILPFPIAVLLPHPGVCMTQLRRAEGPPCAGRLALSRTAW